MYVLYYYFMSWVFLFLFSSRNTRIQSACIAYFLFCWPLLRSRPTCVTCQKTEIRQCYTQVDDTHARNISNLCCMHIQSWAFKVIPKTQENCLLVLFLGNVLDSMGLAFPTMVSFSSHNFLFFVDVAGSGNLFLVSGTALTFSALLEIYHCNV